MNEIERVRRTSSEREREREAESQRKERVTEKAGNIVRDGGKVEIDRYR